MDELLGELRGCAVTPDRVTRLLDRGLFQRMQAFEDAVDYRRARVTAPCRDCGAAAPGEKCDDHSRDLELIAEYREAMRRSVLVLKPPVVKGARPRSG
jgi:hypothetical protein